MVIQKNILGTLEQAPRQAAAMAQRAQALQADASFWESVEALDKHAHVPLWQAVCLLRGSNPAHWALSSPDQARVLQHYATGDIAGRLKELARLLDKAAGHAKAGGLKGFEEPGKGFKTTVKDLTEWAEKVGESISDDSKQTTQKTPEKEPDPKPLQRQKAQGDVILKTLRDMGYEPQCLPKNPSGKDGTKAEVRKALKDNPLFAGTTVFNRAWERLSKYGDIVITKVSP